MNSKGNQMETRPLKNNISKILKNKTTTGVAVGIIFAGSFFVAGIKYERSHAPVRLPSNNACLAYGKAVSDALVASQAQLVDAITGKPKTPVDFENIKKQLSDCTNTSNDYQVTITK